MRLTLRLSLLSAALAFASPAFAQENVLNLYSARHYQTDELLYENFTKQTGIKINRIEADDNQLFERLKSEVAAWEQTRNNAKRTVNWHFKTADARVKLKKLYPCLLP